MRSKAAWWAATAVWTLAIFAVSSMPGSRLPGGFNVEAHFAEYAVLGALLFAALISDRSWVRSLLLATLIASLYAISDEFHQSFVPLRTPDPLDWAIDTLGALCGASLAAAAFRIGSRRRAKRPNESAGRD